MPRKQRVWIPGDTYHITCRGNHQQNIFRDDEDREFYLIVLNRLKVICPFLLHAYCLMDNHIHILLEEQKEPIAMIMKRISSSYVLWFNRKYGRCGHLFQERFNADTGNYHRGQYFRCHLFCQNHE